MTSSLDDSENPEDLYAIFGADSCVSYEELKVQYRKLVLQVHPDKVSEEGKEGSLQEFQKLDRAWKILSDPEQRHQYDTRCRAAQLNQALVNDDVELDDMSWEEDSQAYSHPCRCGGEYLLSIHHALGSRIINCSNCSLCIRVTVDEGQRLDENNDQSECSKQMT